MTATWDTFSQARKSETVPAFRHRQISSPHYHETHFYTILNIKNAIQTTIINTYPYNIKLFKRTIQTILIYTHHLQIISIHTHQ